MRLILFSASLLFCSINVFADETLQSVANSDLHGLVVEITVDKGVSSEGGQRMLIEITASEGQYNFVIPASTGRAGKESLDSFGNPERLYKKYQNRQNTFAFENAIFFKRGYAIASRDPQDHYWFVDGAGRQQFLTVEECINRQVACTAGSVQISRDNASALFSLVNKAGKENTRIEVGAGLLKNL